MDILGIPGSIVAGLVTGFGLNWLADQLPDDQPILKLSCQSCGKPRTWLDYAWLRSCIFCGGRRSVRSWVIQLGMPLLALILELLPNNRIPTILSFCLLTYFILVAVIDIEHRLILGPISLVGVVLGAGMGVFLHGVTTTLFGGLAGGAIMFVLYQIGRLFSTWIARRKGLEQIEDALGFGDVYVGAIIGLVLGWPGITAGLFLAILIGGVVSGISMLTMLFAKNYQPFLALPYAPFLLLATVVLLYRPV
jgi:leader peptidase (prepilin peptidase)/N-methyltransferase